MRCLAICFVLIFALALVESRVEHRLHDLTYARVYQQQKGAEKAQVAQAAQTRDHYTCDESSEAHRRWTKSVTMNAGEAPAKVVRDAIESLLTLRLSGPQMVCIAFQVSTSLGLGLCDAVDLAKDTCRMELVGTDYQIGSWMESAVPKFNRHYRGYDVECGAFYRNDPWVN